MAYFNTMDVQGKSTGSFYPNDQSTLALNDKAQLKLDADGSLETSSVIITDAGSFYEPFADGVLGANWTSQIGTGGSVAVANSRLTINSGTTSSATTSVFRVVDYAPLTITFYASVSQRITNQDIYLGIESQGVTFGAATSFARFHMYGTDNSRVSFESQSSADTNGNQGINTPLILPYGLTTASISVYQIILTNSDVKFFVGSSINALVLAGSYYQIPDPYSVMNVGFRIVNGGSFVGTTTSLTVDTVAVNNYNTIATQTNILTGNVLMAQNVITSMVNSSVVPLTALGTWTFTISTATAATGDTYTNNGQTFTVFAGIAGATSVIMYGTGAPAASGNLVRATGAGTNPIVFSTAVQSDRFTGVAESSLNISGLQVSLYTGQNCTVYVDQSPDGVNWDIQDVYNYNYQNLPNFGVTTQAISAFYRVRVINDSSILGTGAFRLQSVMCPIVEALPRSLSEEGNLKVGVYEIEDASGHIVKITPSGNLAVANTVKLVGASFDGSYLDTNFWTSTLVSGGTIVASGQQIELKTNTTANGASYLTSSRIARQINGTSNLFQGYVNVTASSVTNNTKRWGVATAFNYTFTVTSANATAGDVYTNNGQEFIVLTTIVAQTTLSVSGSGAPTATGSLIKITGAGDATIAFSTITNQNTPSDGYLFELANGVPAVLSVKGSTINRVTNGSFNGDYGTTVNTVPTDFSSYEIVYNMYEIIMSYAGKIVHRFVANTTPLVNTTSLPLYAQNFNTSGGTTNTSLKITDFSILRLGESNTKSIWKWQSGANTGPVILKRGCGTLQKVIINSWSTASTITLFDSLSNTGTIASIAPFTSGTAYARNPIVLLYDLDFYIGLSWTTTGTIDVTIIYE